MNKFNALFGMLIFNHFFLNLFFNLLTFFLQNIYNTRLKKRYDDDPSTHSNIDLDLWLEARLSDRLDKN